MRKKNLVVLILSIMVFILLTYICLIYMVWIFVDILEWRWVGDDSSKLSIPGNNQSKISNWKRFLGSQASKYFNLFFFGFCWFHTHICACVCVNAGDWEPQGCKCMHTHACVCLTFCLRLVVMPLMVYGFGLQQSYHQLLFWLLLTDRVEWVFQQGMI